LVKYSFKDRIRDIFIYTIIMLLLFMWEINITAENLGGKLEIPIIKSF